MKILFLCVQNAGRSQMSAAFARKYFGNRAEIYNAGSNPADHVHPEVAEALREVNIDISGEAPKGLNDLPDVVFDYVITMGCGDVCPSSKARNKIDWQLEDPKGKGIDAVRKIRDEIESRVKGLNEQLSSAGA